MVSKLGHCLNDLLYRWRIGALQLDIAAIVSNHPDFASLAETYGIPYHHVPVTPQTKAEAEATLSQLVAESDVELVVLARTCRSCPTTCASSSTARPSTSTIRSCRASREPSRTTRLYERGVKLIGATAHYVTPDLDEGPVIEQDRSGWTTTTRPSS